MHRKFTCSLIVYSRRTFKKIECVILITSTMVSVIFYFFPIDQQDFIQINKHLIVSRDGRKDSKTKAEKNAVSVWWAWKRPTK